MLELILFIAGKLNLTYNQPLLICLFALGIVYVNLIHWIADFRMQTDDVAKGKSESNKILMQHITIYCSVVFFTVGPIAAVTSLIAHSITDYFTSRASKKAFLEERRHDFFVIIGFDQFLHKAQLIISLLIAFIIYLKL